MTLFDKDPAFRYLRDSKGRFATPEKAMYDRVERENRLLRLQVEKYRRLAEMPIKTIIRQQRTIQELKEKIHECAKDL